MAAMDIVNRVFREFRRYTGDGLPGEPANAPLPVGDPSSGVNSPKKSEIRAALGDVLEDAQGSADLAAGYAALLAGASSIEFITVDDLLADTALGYEDSGATVEVPVGKLVRAGTSRYVVAPEDATDHQVETAGGLKLYLLNDGASSTTYSLTAAVASSALTISLKTADGADPSGSNPVNLAFRDANMAVGAPSLATIESALTLTISSGSTLGFTNATAGRLWIVAFNDGGTVRLGAINCRSGTNLFPLGGSKVASAVAEGGAGGADSPHVFYASSALTSKAYVILGYMDWGSGLVTAGTWAAAPTAIKIFDLGDKLPGDVIQSVGSTTQTQTTVASTTYVDTNSTVTLTPTAAPNLVSVFASGSLGIVASVGDRRCQARIVRGGTQIGIGAQLLTPMAGAIVQPASMMAMDAPGTVSPCTWKVQINAQDASQTGFWANGGTGPVAGATMSAAEIMG